MTKVFCSILFSLVFGACTETVRVVHDVVRCADDTQCNDGNVDTEDSCAPTGVCSHLAYRDRTLGCESDTDCEDGNLTTVDTCEMGICHRATTTIIEVPPTFDPSDSRRQDARDLCEMPSTCETVNVAKLNTFCGERVPWPSYGYFLSVAHGPLTTTTIHAAPRLWVGDPSDRFHVVVAVDGTMRIDREMSVPEIEAGLEIDIGDDGRSFTINFSPAGDLNSRTIQWAFLPGDITDASGNPLTTCLQTGPFMTVPPQGFLTFQETPDHHLACVGTPRRVTTIPTLWLGWVREESDPTLHYARLAPDPARAIYDMTAEEGIDWIATNRATICSELSVVPDGSLLGTIRRDIGVRPGTAVSWTDSSGVRHDGMADRNYLLHDFGTADPLMGGLGACSNIYELRGLGGGCSVDLSSRIDRYTTVPIMQGVLRPSDLFEGTTIEEYFFN